jgi:ATP-dependent Lon protease
VKDLVDIPDNVKNRLEIIPVKWIDNVLAHALERAPEPLQTAAPEAIPPAPVVGEEPANTGLMKH